MASLRVQIDSLQLRLNEKQEQEKAWNEHTAKLKEKVTQQKIAISALEDEIKSLKGSSVRPAPVVEQVSSPF